MKSAPVLWILARGKLGSLALGPMVRYLEMAKVACREGFSVRLCLDDCSVALPNGIEYVRLSNKVIAQIDPSDKIVASIYLDPYTLKALVDSDRSFDVDFYGVGAMEGMETTEDLPLWRLFQGRRRTRLRYGILLRHARHIYVSTPEQLTFLGGLLFAASDKASCELASRLPERTLMLPMGVRDTAFPTVAANPYPIPLQGRPLFLWGGGIWAWFDIETLLQAFVHLRSWGSPAVLFFLCGSNPSGLSSQDAPVRNAVDRARQLGLTGENVFFLDGGSSSEALPGYLAHCTAGIMANPSRLESYGSWRTRLLDLLWARKPVVASGFDPLSSQMAEKGLGILTPAQDPHQLALAIREFVPPSTDSFSDLADSLSWSRTLASWATLLHEPAIARSHRPGVGLWLRYALGI